MKTSKKVIQLTIEKSQELKKLARMIRETYDSTEALIEKAQRTDCEAIAEAMQCGKALNEAKQIVGHGKWLKWLAENCKKISEDTAQRYMKLAKTAHVRNLKDAKSLRQAYILVGIIPEITPGEVPAEPEQTTQERVSQSLGVESDSNGTPIKFEQFGNPAPKPAPLEPQVTEQTQSEVEELQSKVPKEPATVPALMMFEKVVLEVKQRFELLDPKQQKKAKKILKEKLSEVL